MREKTHLHKVEQKKSSSPAAESANMELDVADGISISPPSLQLKENDEEKAEDTSLESGSGELQFKVDGSANPSQLAEINAIVRPLATPIIQKQEMNNEFEDEAKEKVTQAYMTAAAAEDPPEDGEKKGNANSLAFQMKKDPVQRKKEANSPQTPSYKPNNTGLPDNLKSGMETLSGYSLDDVKVHYNSAQPAQLKAHAYARGTDIHIGPGQEKHLPHEAWHVVQQKQGRVKSTVQLKGMNINNDISLENEADKMGTKAVQLMSTNKNTTSPSSIQESLPIQKKNDNKPVYQFGLFDWFGPYNPRLYLPTGIGGHSYTHQAERALRGSSMPTQVKQRLLTLFQFVPDIAFCKIMPNFISITEFEEVVSVLDDIYNNKSNLVISPQLSQPSHSYDDGEEASLKEELKMETLQDLAKISQTSQGRNLLKRISREEQELGVKNTVIIKPSDALVAPDAAPLIKPTKESDYKKKQRAYVNYSPSKVLTDPTNHADLQPYRDAQGANPWIILGRSDVALFHELVHTHHIQRGEFLPKTDIMTRGDSPSADPIDIPGEGGKPVSKEEYKTVGIAPYQNEEFTDRKYRSERRALGEHVPDRPYYTNK